MANILRKSPPVCLAISLAGILTGKLRFNDHYLGQSIKMKDGKEFEIFRHVSGSPLKQKTPTIFIVSFNFFRLSHQGNKIASFIPMLMIAGFPGFEIKIYAVDRKSGAWQGMYQWESDEALENYKRSFVFRTMNKRAEKDSLSSFEFRGSGLLDYIERIKM